MRSLKFPNMFNSNSTNVWRSDEYREATFQNLRLVLSSEKNSLKCDPYFGGLIDSLLFEQNNYILKEILIDILYEQAAIFIPQLKVSRDGISIIQDKEKGRVYATIHGINQLDYENDTYTLLLTKDLERN